MRRAIALGLTVLLLYGLAPAVVDVLGAWPEATDIEPWWYALMIAAQAGSVFCLWMLQELCIGTDDRRAVATSQLASGALGRVVPGGAAVAVATQYTMLARADVSRTAAGTGLTAAALLQFAALCALPLLAVPSVVLGVHVADDLLRTSLAALVLFGGMLGVTVVLLRSDRALDRIVAVGDRVAARLGNQALEREELLDRAVAQRRELTAALGDGWPKALGAAVGRWLLDLVCLISALAAVGAEPRWSLVLLAFTAAQLLAQVPLTPGGIGVVEAGLAATLVLAGVGGGAATVATLAYRLVSHWLMLPAGFVGWVLHRRAYG